jgi:1,4-alpha-glucan branching enzyme
VGEAWARSRSGLRLLSTVAMVATIVGGACATTRSAAAPAATPDGVRFVFARPDARSVSLAGSFNQWSLSSNPMTRADPTGDWTILVRLPPGEHLFMYVVDGTQWISPPLAEDYSDDGFGTRNGVVVVRPNEP